LLILQHLYQTLAPVSHLQGEIKMQVEPTMLLKTNDAKMSVWVEPTMLMKTQALKRSESTMFMIPKQLSCLLGGSRRDLRTLARRKPAAQRVLTGSQPPSLLWATARHKMSQGKPERISVRRYAEPCWKRANRRRHPGHAGPPAGRQRRDLRTGSMLGPPYKRRFWKSSADAGG
jgi:hypothetical protein